jgi:hypothetical protein
MVNLETWFLEDKDVVVEAMIVGVNGVGDRDRGRYVGRKRGIRV